MHLERFTKANLIHRLHVLQQQVDVGGLHDLQAHHEELRTQNEQLVEAQLSLEQSRDRYAELFDVAPVGYATLSSVGAIETVNLTLSHLLGFERRLLLRRSFRSFVDASDRHLFLDHLGDCGRGETMHSVELRLVSAAGTPIPVRLSSRVMASRSIWTVVTDLTEHARVANEQRQVLVREAASSAASDAKDRFLAVLSHELRTPLTPILAAVSSFADVADTPPALRALLEIVRRNVVTETRLIDDLLDVTRIENHKLHLDVGPVDLHEIAREAAGEPIVAVAAAAPTHEVLLDLAAASHHVAADRTRLHQVVWNLLGNARRYSPDGGVITLRTRDEAPGWLRFSVEDHGIGIEPDLIGKLFTPFKQGGHRTPGARGLGLGLAICKGIVNAHGGEITVRSPGAGRGTTVDVRWKTTTATPAAASPAIAAAPIRVSKRRLRILLVEDDADSAVALAMLLRLDHHEVVVANTCGEALDRCDPPPDVMISDLDLPDGTGVELVRKLRLRSRVPALALTGYGSPADFLRSREAGFDEHLVKPVERVALIAAIERVTSLRAASL